MEDKRNDLIGKFNQLRLELGAIELGIDLSNIRKQTVIAQLKATQTQYDQVSAQLEKSQAATGVVPEPEVGLTDDAKKELVESLQSNLVEEKSKDESTVQTPSETPAA